MITIILCRWLLMNPWRGGAAPGSMARRLQMMTMTLARSLARAAQRQRWGSLAENLVALALG